ELWNGNTANPSMNSQNHVMLLGDLIVWYYENLAGIKAASPAFKKIIMKPERIEGLSFVNASYHSMYGEIKSSWKRNKGNFSWNISIPANTSALVYIPASSADKVKESGKKADRMGGAKFIKMDGGYAVFEVGSGNYAFTAN